MNMDIKKRQSGLFPFTLCEKTKKVRLSGELSLTILDFSFSPSPLKKWR